MTAVSARHAGSKLTRDRSTALVLAAGNDSRVQAPDNSLLVPSVQDRAAGLRTSPEENLIVDPVMLTGRKPISYVLSTMVSPNIASAYLKTACQYIHHAGL